MDDAAAPTGGAPQHDPRGAHDGDRARGRAPRAAGQRGGPTGGPRGAGGRRDQRTGASEGPGDSAPGGQRASAPAGQRRGAPVPQRGGAGTSRADRPRGLDRPRIVEPELPDEVTGRELDRDVRGDLSTLSKDNADAVARHLVMAGLLLQDDPERAHEHALAAQRRAGRVGVVREAAGLTAYAAGRHDEALRELRAARRLTGSAVHLPVMADCERGLGRPERAIALAQSPEAEQLDAEGRAELRIVVSGARLDLGQPDAAVIALQGPDLSPTRPEPWHARTFTAYADALRAAGRDGEAQAWERRALAVDPRGASGARPPASGAPGGGGGVDAAAHPALLEVTVYDVADDIDDAADAAGPAPGDGAPTAGTGA